jgi:hypothetical protein
MALLQLVQVEVVVVGTLEQVLVALVAVALEREQE